MKHELLQNLSKPRQASCRTQRRLCALFCLTILLCVLFRSAAAAQGGCFQPPSGMVAWWPMDDPVGPNTVLDYSGYGHTGSLKGVDMYGIPVSPVTIGSTPGPTVVVSVPWGGSVLPQVVNALFFNRTYAEVATSTDFDIGANGLTITLWFHTAGAITPIQPLLDKWKVNNGYSLYLDSWLEVPCTYNLNFNLNGDVITFLPPIQSPIGSIFPWYFVAVTVQNDGTVTLYVNSPNPNVPPSLKGATDTTSVTPWQMSNGAPLWIAGNRSIIYQPLPTDNNPYQAAIGGYPAAELALDEVEIFNRALGPNELQSIYDGESIGRRKCNEPTGVIEHSDVPTGHALLQSYPNPFNSTATIEYQVPVSSFVKLSVFNILDREVAILVNEVKPVGNYRVAFDGSNLPAGMYFYRMQAGKFQETRKLILLK